MNEKIIYFTIKWFGGTAYKNIKFMKNNFGGEIVRDDIPRVRRKIAEIKPDFMVVHGYDRKNYKIPLEYNIPYVLLEHDVYSLLYQDDAEVLKQDKEQIENASAVIFTSEDHAKYYEKLRKEQGWKIPYYEVIHTRPLKEDLDFNPRPKMKGLNLVYAGGTVSKWRDRRYHFGHRCLHEIFKKFIEVGWKVHIYSINNRVEELTEYQEMGCIIHDRLLYKELLEEMSQYTAGFLGYNKSFVPQSAYNYARLARPNKIWDYLIAGIPTIGFQDGEGSKIYNNKWGIIIDNLEKETLQDIPEKLKGLNITKEMRYDNVMEKDLDKYKKVFEVAGKEKK